MLFSADGNNIAGDRALPQLPQELAEQYAPEQQSAEQC